MLNRNFVILTVTIAVVFTVLAQANTQEVNGPDRASENKSITLTNKMNLRGLNLYGRRFVAGSEPVADVNFSNARLKYAFLPFDYEELPPITTFKNCNFREAVMNHTFVGEAVVFVDCDFTDAIINDAQINLSPKNLAQTRSYKQRDLRGVKMGDCWWAAERETPPSFDFSNCNLKNATLPRGLCNCKFDNAIIEDTTFNSHGYPLRVEQLYSTKSYKQGTIINCAFGNFDFTNANFANVNLTGSSFNSCDFKNAKMDDAIISRCRFPSAKNLVLAQIKSTWNYKHNRMDGIVLPKDTQDELDKEKKK
ncbi:MAG: pentapeptide repeat-containing protein [Planctomycetaceae bacterium]|jgi:uncharacterized protein YjbI with pentapeptide repeats|nr:pentapeptide repeat-containing protein [Planctomycetaceae bacterium]